MKFYALLISPLIVSMIESKPLDGSIERTRDTEIAKEISTEIPTDVETTPAGDANSEETNAASPPPFNHVPNLLLPLLQRIQFSPPLFFQERLNQLKESLAALGIVAPSKNDATPKQLPTTNGLSQLVGLNDSGFYTNRLEPAGFLGGNGWFANKGGILGGPGAILSTGSLLTDYPTPYRK